MRLATATGERARRALLALRDAPETDAGLEARTLGSLYLAGALIGLVSVLLPHSGRADDAGLFSNIGFAFIGGIGLLTFSARIPRWMIHAVLVLGSLVITRAIVLSGDSVSFYSVWFIWVGLFAFYFFSRPAAAAHVAFVAVLYAVTLMRDTPSSPVARWLTTVATLVVAGVLIDTLVRRSRLQATSAAASARSMGRVIAVAHELAGLSDSAAARPALCEAAARVTQAEAAILWEPSADGTSLHATATARNETEPMAVPFAGPPAGAPQAFTTGETITRGAHLWKPILREDRPIGVLELSWADPVVRLDRSVRALADLLAVEVAVTLERVSLLAELETIARTDELTGLPNRRAWQEELPQEMARAMRSQPLLCVAMLDLDHFKRYNDDRGHQTGDRLLKQVAGAWNSELRPTDLLARYGGEEFALALPACGAEEALAVVERLRAVMPDEQTCSAGLACWDGTESAGELLGRADHALYEAKRSGRNRSAMSLVGPETSAVI
jgi:diguanylate cyclase (GGDEF)-like protein